MSARDVIANTLMPGGYADAGTFAAADDVLHDLAIAGYTVTKLHRVWWGWGNDEDVVIHPAEYDGWPDDPDATPLYVIKAES